jgi:hypothetical protein
MAWQDMSFLMSLDDNFESAHKKIEELETGQRFIDGAAKVLDEYIDEVLGSNNWVEMWTVTLKSGHAYRIASPAPSVSANDLNALRDLANILAVSIERRWSYVHALAMRDVLADMGLPADLNRNDLPGLVQFSMEQAPKRIIEGLTRHFGPINRPVDLFNIAIEHNLDHSDVIRTIQTYLRFRDCLRWNRLPPFAASDTAPHDHYSAVDLTYGKAPNAIVRVSVHI